ncbi:hypothetical protein CHS0354_008467 [Potamilus streckersoni]|uniref:Amine oxidase n=1 Tax=Potamilus streckersoni TaxID=2493646 RepID=A0AAE0RPX9_9BIVA|nr:hypothetical protein CHS0354_008467 [Potamilus streckersoni]
MELSAKNTSTHPKSSEDPPENEEHDSETPLTNSKEKRRDKELEELKWSQQISCRIVTFGAIIIVVILAIVVVVLATRKPEPIYCKSGFEVKPRDFRNPNIFDDLTPEEYRATRDYMLSVPSLKLIPFGKATVNSSYILSIDLFPPMKADALAYLDKGARMPDRVANVVIVRGDAQPPAIEEYLVSPLPFPTNHKLYRNPAYRRHLIPHTSHIVDNVEIRFLHPMATKLSEQLYEVFMESYGLCYHNCTLGINCMTFFETAPSGRKSGERKTWMWAFKDIDGLYIQPLGFEILIEHKSTIVEEWKIEMIVYNGQKFESVDEFLNKYKRNEIKKINLKKTSDIYSTYLRRGKDPLPKATEGPRLMEPEGRRFSVSGQHVNYMNWDFDIHMRTITGLQVLDIRFQGERIAYEVSLQEVLVVYSGYGPTQGTTFYYDASWFLGGGSFELARGVDCPDTAVYIDVHHLVNSEDVLRHKNSICIFEENAGMPLRRHYFNAYARGNTAYGGLLDHHLVVRTVATIWNYDYLFDYIFYLNGAIEVKVSATGYVQATFDLLNERPYGSLIYEGVMANLHQHLFHFKADMDIGGLRNNYATLDIGLETINHPWFKNETKSQIHFTPREKKHEMDSVKFSDKMPSYHIIYNNRTQNRQGQTKAYRVYNRGAVEFIMAGQSIANACKWAKYPIAVTKQKDTEYMSTSIYAQMDPWDPILDFEDFLSDNESIWDEDLVAWVTMGVYHIPSAEDVPSTPTAWSKLSFFLAPFNYFDECPSMSSYDLINIYNVKNNNELKVDMNGKSTVPACSQKTEGPFKYYGALDPVK